MMFFVKKEKMTVKSYPKSALAVACALICLFVAVYIATFSANAEDFSKIDSPSATKMQKCLRTEKEFTTAPQNTPRSLKYYTTTPQNTSKMLNASTTGGESSTYETLPEEYRDFIDSLPEDLIDTLPEDLLSGRADSLDRAAREMSGAGYLLSSLSEALGMALSESLPTLATLCGIVVLAAVAHTFGSSLGTSLASAVDFAARLCTYSAIAVVSVGGAERLEAYFTRLLATVGGFLPLSAALYAMGGNFTSAVSSSAALSATLTVCELFLCKSVVPMFCISLSLSLLQAFEGGGALAAQSVSATLKKWYTTALGFIMALLTTAIAAQSIISTKADNAAMRGVKFAAGSFIPVSGGTISATLSTLSASVELLRGSVGVVGIVVILLLLLPVVVELAIMRGVISLAAFLSGMLGCGGEQRLLNEVGTLYGYLEGIAALSAVVFIIAFGIFATTTAAV